MISERPGLLRYMAGITRREVRQFTPNPGQQLRQLRCSLGLTLRDVEASSYRIAAEHQNGSYAIPFSRLYEIESKGMLPTIYRLYSLSAIYGNDYGKLLCMFGIELGRLGLDLNLSSAPVTHKISAQFPAAPVLIDDDSPTTKPVARAMQSTIATTSIGGIRETEFASEQISLIHVGSEDFTMFPLISPCSLLEVDGSIRKVRSTGWHSEHDRPIYLFETRQDGFRVGWCSLSNRQLTIQPHPLSPTPAKTYRYPVEAEVIGQVVALTTRLAPAGYANGAGPKRLITTPVRPSGSNPGDTVSRPTVLSGTRGYRSGQHVGGCALPGWNDACGGSDDTSSTVAADIQKMKTQFSGTSEVERPA